MNQIKKMLMGILGILLAIGVGLLTGGLFLIIISVSRTLSKIGLKLLGDAIIFIGTLAILFLVVILLCKLQKKYAV